jgi:glycosyltransferase involved in cell wall biosynthesis
MTAEARAGWRRLARRARSLGTGARSGGARPAKRPPSRWGSQRPRALIVVQNLPVPLDRRVWLESLALRDAGWDVAVICPQGPGDPAYEELEGIQLHKYPSPPQTRGKLSFVLEFVYCWLATAWLTLRVVRRGRPTVLQACNPPDTYFALAAPLKLLGVRFVFDQHDLCPELYETKFGGRGLLHRLLLRLERATYAVADHVVAPNASYREAALRRGGLQPQQVTVVRNGPDLARLHRVEPVPDLRAGRRFLCCYLGIMGPQDGVDVLLHAAHHLVHGSGRTDVHFALLGFGDELDNLKALTTDLALWPWVTFTGRADDDMVRRYLSTADVGLSPDPTNAFNDVSTMNKTMEYMAFGLPVVAFDLKETRVSAGAAAVYVPGNDPRAFADALACLLDDPERRAAMGAAGRRRVGERLVWSKQVPAYVALFDALRSPAPLRV